METSTHSIGYRMVDPSYFREEYRPHGRTRIQERRKPCEGAEPGENFSVVVLALTLIVEVLGR